MNTELLWSEYIEKEGTLVVHCSLSSAYKSIKN